jgi:tricorn protease
MKSHALKMTPQTDNERHTQPIWHGDKVFFLSERDFANNIWSFDPKSETLKQETFHTDFDIKNLDSNGSEIVYEQGGYIHILNPATGTTKQFVNQRQRGFSLGKGKVAGSEWQKPYQCLPISHRPKGYF